MNEYSTVIVWCLVIIGCVVGAFVVATLVRRRYMARHDDVPAAGFTLSDLRQLHQSGQMSTEEFEKARSAMIEATKRSEERRKAEQAARANPLQAIIDAEQKKRQ